MVSDMGHLKKCIQLDLFLFFDFNCDYNIGSNYETTQLSRRKLIYVLVITALTFSIQTMFGSCLMVFTGLKRIKFDKSKFHIHQNIGLVGY